MFKIISLVLLVLVSSPFGTAFSRPPSSTCLFGTIANKKTTKTKDLFEHHEFIRDQNYQNRYRTIVASEASSNQEKASLRNALRKLTGFSLTAIRATTRSATGVSITGLLSSFFAVLPLWVRGLMQPFLILYYTPLMILRSMVGTTRTSKIEARQAHEHFIEGWKEAVDIAEKVNEDGYWPVHVNENGTIDFKSLPDPDDVLKTNEFANAIVDSIEVASTLSEEQP